MKVIRIVVLLSMLVLQNVCLGRLLSALNAFVKQDEQTAVQTRHPLFGEKKLQEKGWAMYKHLDHHLPQFGI